jgi:hypothetical protein
MSSEFRHRASLALNVVLSVAAVVLVLHRSDPTPMESLNLTNETPVETPVLTKPPKGPRYPEAVSASDQRRWLIDQLRAMGVPNKVLAQIVLEDLDWGWNKRGGEVSLQSHGDPDTMAALKLENAMSLDAEMRAALGEDGFKQWDYENMLRESNSGKIALTASETDATYNQWKKLRQLELKLRQAKLKGEIDDVGISEAFGKAFSELEQQMKVLLGDKRYAQSQQTDDGNAAENLRQTLAKANPSDSQFQVLLQGQQQLNEQRAALDKQFQDDHSSAAYTEKIKALDAARDQEYRRVLGDNAFNTLQKQQDAGYNQMKKHETIWGLDDNSINSVYGTMKYYQKSVAEYQAQVSALEAGGQAVDREAVNKNLQQFAEQTQQALQNYLGQDRFNRMAQNGVFQLSPPDMTGHVKPAH